MADPDLRTQLGTPPALATYPQLESVELVGGFLSGQTIEFSPDLNCLLGGTGAGKSLILEAIRYALDQQVDLEAFPAIHGEVHARLKTALGNGMVKLQFRTGGSCYRVERPFTGDADAVPRVLQNTGDDWVAIDVHPAQLISIAAFSQGEVLEYSRQPVGRMSLVDAGIDLADVDARIAEAKAELVANGTAMLAARKRVARLREGGDREADLAEQVRELGKLFDSAVVKQQEGWTKEASKLKKVGSALNELAPHPLQSPSALGAHDVAENADLFAKASTIVQTLQDTHVRVVARHGCTDVIPVHAGDVPIEDQDVVVVEGDPLQCIDSVEAHRPTSTAATMTPGSPHTDGHRRDLATSPMPRRRRRSDRGVPSSSNVQGAGQLAEWAPGAALEGVMVQDVSGQDPHGRARSSGSQSRF